MKTLPSLVVCLVLSLTLAGQAAAQKHSLPIDGINKALQMKIDNQVVFFLSDELELLEKSQLSSPLQQKEIQNNQPGIYLAPDCLCHLFTRVM